MRNGERPVEFTDPTGMYEEIGEDEYGHNIIWTGKSAINTGTGTKGDAAVDEVEKPNRVTAIAAESAEVAINIATCSAENASALISGTLSGPQFYQDTWEILDQGIEDYSEVSSFDRTYLTYTKTNPLTGQVYSGRTSGTGSPLDILSSRDSSHHMNQKGFGPAVLDKVSSSKDAIRGREQILIDMHGGAQSFGGTSGNAINGVSPLNPFIDKYINAAILEF